MSEINPFLPPQSNVADQSEDHEVDIDSLPVSDTWKKRFKWLRSAGGPSMSNLKNLPKEQQKSFVSLNILAFLFGPFYYLAKGMWKKAISLFTVCFAVIFLLEIVLIMAGFGGLAKALGYGGAAVFGVRANIDYYKKMVMNDNGWW